MKYAGCPTVWHQICKFKWPKAPSKPTSSPCQQSFAMSPCWWAFWRMQELKAFQTSPPFPKSTAAFLRISRALWSWPVSQRCNLEPSTWTWDFIISVSMQGRDWSLSAPSSLWISKLTSCTQSPSSNNPLKGSAVPSLVGDVWWCLWMEGVWRIGTGPVYCRIGLCYCLSVHLLLALALLLAETSYPLFRVIAHHLIICLLMRSHLTTIQGLSWMN